jgi:hypothetical protein
MKIGPAIAWAPIVPAFGVRWSELVSQNAIESVEHAKFIVRRTSARPLDYPRLRASDVRFDLKTGRAVSPDIG